MKHHISMRKAQPTKQLSLELFNDEKMYADIDLNRRSDQIIVLETANLTFTLCVWSHFGFTSLLHRSCCYLEVFPSGIEHPSHAKYLQTNLTVSITKCHPLSCYQIFK
jgi:hypothetical protein